MGTETLLPRYRITRQTPMNSSSDELTGLQYFAECAVLTNRRNNCQQWGDRGIPISAAKQLPSRSATVINTEGTDGDSGSRCTAGINGRTSESLKTAQQAWPGWDSLYIQVIRKLLATTPDR